MSNIQLIIEERAADIGNFLVGRLLPFREKRSVGPFVFIDHMGPAQLKNYQNLDVPPHPHIGLSTLTYLFEGAIFHRDSLGTEMEIQPGAVNWMTAGKGVVHSERTPEYLRTSEKSLHGLQIWVALPKHLEQTEPTFHHTEAKDIPQWEQDGVQIKLIAGKAFGKNRPFLFTVRCIFLKSRAKMLFQLISGNIFSEKVHYTFSKVLSKMMVTNIHQSRYSLQRIQSYVPWNSRKIQQSIFLAEKLSLSNAIFIGIL